jgi:hypothetical protein
MEEKFIMLKDVVTPEIQVMISKENGVRFSDNSIYMDADEELKEIANYVRIHSPHNSEVDCERIKYLYTTQAKKDGGKYTIGQLIARKDMEKMVNNDYDYILIVHYRTWKELDIEHKVIQMDKLLCGVLVTDDNKVKKNQVDSKEYINNMRHYGAEKVLQSTEVVDMTVERIVESEKDEKRAL